MKIKENKWAILSGLICIVLVLAIILIPLGKKENDSVELSEYSSINEICELATLRSYYHNVAIYEAQTQDAGTVIVDILTWPFNYLLKPGYKQFWLEYSGIVETGINLKEDRILINNPDTSGVVEIYVPDAKVLNVDADENSFSKPMDDAGIFVAITAKERAAAYAKAQGEMRQEAEKDHALLRRAKNNAKILLEKYIVNLGKELGVNYTVRWVEKPWQ